VQIARSSGQEIVYEEMLSQIIRHKKRKCCNTSKSALKSLSKYDYYYKESPKSEFGTECVREGAVGFSRIFSQTIMS